MKQDNSTNSYPTKFPPQHQQHQPGNESMMKPLPIFSQENYQGSNKLLGKVAFVSGGDSGIGRAVSILFAQEGADVAISYLHEHEDANETKGYIEQVGRRCLLIAGDIGNESICQAAIAKTMTAFGRLDIVVNNAAEQHVQTRLEDISAEQLERTFRTNIFSYFYVTKAALPHLKEGSSIINTSSITAYQGHEQLMDYASTKGAIVTFTRSLSQNLLDRGIRVNGVAPGPIWTPLIPASFNEAHVEQFGSNSPMKRAGQPVEVAPAYLFLASNDSSYMTGQILHPNGGTVVNG